MLINRNSRKSTLQKYFDGSYGQVLNIQSHCKKIHSKIFSRFQIKLNLLKQAIQIFEPI